MSNGRQEDCKSTPRGTLKRHRSLNTPSSLSRSNSSRTSSERVNPFNSNLLNSLHLSVWSPSIFGKSNEKSENDPTDDEETPPEKKWAIDHVAKLYPSNIEESPSTHQNDIELDPETEAKAQEAIEKFFNQSCVVPSPLMASSPINSSYNINNYSNSSLSSCKRDSWTNTHLHFPPEMPSEITSLLSQFCVDEPLSSSMSVQPSFLNSSNSNNSLPRRLEFSFNSDDTTQDTSLDENIPSPKAGIVHLSPDAEDVKEKERDRIISRTENDDESRKFIFCSPDSTPIRPPPNSRAKSS